MIFNKYIALIIILIILVICYFYIKNRNKSKEKATDSPSSKKKTQNAKNKKKTSNTKQPEKLQNKSAPADQEKEKNDEEEEETNDENEAAELYKLVHKELIKGISSEEYLQIVGNKSNVSVYIELRQLYNKCKNKNLDPNREITVEDYKNILEGDLAE